MAGSATLTAVLSTVTTVVPRMHAASTRRLVASDNWGRPALALTSGHVAMVLGRRSASPHSGQSPHRMRQLTSLDAQFLAVESARTYGHVGGLAVYDPSTAPGGTLEIADICRLVGERLYLLPPFRWRLVGGAVRARSSLLDRGPGLRSRLPHPRVRRPLPGRRPAPGRDRRPHLRPPARPAAPAVGAVPDPGARRRPRGAPDEDPPFGGRRRLGQRDPQRPARPQPRGPRAARRRARAPGPRAGRAGDARPRPALAAAPAGAGPALDPDGAPQPDHAAGGQRLPGRAHALARSRARAPPGGRRGGPERARGDDRAPAADAVQRPDLRPSALLLRLALAGLA